MNRTLSFVAFILALAFVSCVSSSEKKVQAILRDTTSLLTAAQRQTAEPTPQTAVPRQPAQPAASPPQTTAPQQPAQPAAPSPPPPPPSPFYTGDGGKGMSIAILTPKAAGLAENQMYLTALVQGEFVSNFSGYSAISVLDRERLDEQYGELLSGYYADNAEAGQDLGRLTPTAYIMGGSITKTTTGYALQIAVTKTADKMTVASYSGTCTFAELDNLSGIRRASLDLLQKMGIAPSERTKTELAGAAADSHVNAQTALAQGITAQKSGTVVEALSYYIQSTGYDPGLAEAASRMNILSADIRSGNIGNDVRNDIQWRRDWIARLREAETFYANYFKQTPPYYLVYSTDIKQGVINYQNETVALTIQIAALPEAEWFKTINSVILTVREGLVVTGRTETWGLDWPAKSMGSPSPFTSQAKTWAVVVEIVNSEGKSIGRQTVNLPYGWNFENSIAAPVVTRYRELTFPAVNANLISDRLTVRISSIDGVPSENAARQQRINIVPEAEYRRIPSVQENAMYPHGNGFYLDNGHFNIAYGVTSIGEGRVFNDMQLTSVSIPNSVTSIGSILGGERVVRFSGPFVNNKLTSVTIPNSVTVIPDHAFETNPLTSVTIPNTVTIIGYGAFGRNQLLTIITIGANVLIRSGDRFGTSFDNSFTEFYNNSGKKAGTYTYNKSTKAWSFSAQ